SKSQSTNNISVRLIGACANVVAQSAASPAISIFRSSNPSRRAARSSVFASAIYTRIIYLSYDTNSPTTSIGWGVCISTTWGRYKFLIYAAIYSRALYYITIPSSYHRNAHYPSRLRSECDGQPRHDDW